MRAPLRIPIPTRTTLALLASLLVLPGIARANPPGIPAGEKLVWKFNLIGKPRDFTGDCGSGNRLFVNRDAKNEQIFVVNGSTWAIVDCNATGGGHAIISTNQAATYDIFVRILGKPGGNVFICADTLTDPTTQETLCLLGTIDLTRGSGQSKFQIAPTSMFDASNIDILWTVDTTPDFRIAQFRVYQRP